MITSISKNTGLLRNYISYLLFFKNSTQIKVCAIRQHTKHWTFVWCLHSENQLLGGGVTQYRQQIPYVF